MSETLDALLNPGTETEPENPIPKTAPETPADWVKDRTTGEYRPRKRRGRRAGTPPPAEHEPINRTEDEAPDSKSRGKRQAAVPRWKAGVIAKGMEKFYRRTGRIVKAMDRDLGIAIIESAEECGEAWDDVARTNPRIRAFLLKMITGGSWAALFWAHAPIFMALLMKDAIRKRIPFGRFLESALEPDDDGTNDISEMLGGMGPEDMQQMMNVGMQMINRMGFGSVASAEMPVDMESE